MKLLMMPGQLTADESYWLFCDPDTSMALRVRTILAWASPQALFLGMGRKLPVEGTIVIFEADFLDRLPDLDANGIVKERIRYLPIPENYPWAFWDVWSWFENRSDLLAQSTSLEAYKQAIAFCPYFGGASNPLKVQSWHSLADGALYWNEHRAYFDTHKSNLELVMSRLADTRSRHIYALALRSNPEELWQHFMALRAT